MKLGIPVYEGVDLLDVTGPYEMFGWVDSSKGLETVIVSSDGGEVTSGNGVRFNAHASFAEVPALDVVWVPGGTPAALQAMMRDPHSAYFAYLRKVAANAKWVCSVCEGALLLARAGLLDATTRQPIGHSWAACRSSLRLLSTQPTSVLSYPETG